MRSRDSPSGRGRTARLVSELERAGTPAGGRVALDSIGPLPAPVERYFRLVLRDGQPRVRSVRMRQSGTFRSGERGDPEAGWSRFLATQWLTADPPGFVWEARIRMAPLLGVRVCDGYVAGRATMRATLASLVTVVDAEDAPSLRAGALHRFLAEAVWLPTALLPGRGVSWTAMDDSRARATLSHAGTTVALEFEFAPGGEIVACYAPARVRAVPGRKGQYGAAPWGGRYRCYEEHAGMRVPTAAEVYWVLEGREQPYYRGCNVSLDYRLESDGSAG